MALGPLLPVDCRPSGCCERSDGESWDDDRNQCFHRILRLLITGGITWLMHGAVHTRQKILPSNPARKSRWRHRPQITFAGSSWGLIPAGSASPGTVAAIGAGVCLAEHNCQQARAQEHEAGRRQGKKSVGDNVVVAHETPTTSDARPNLLKLSESPVETTESFLSETGGYPTASRSKLKLWNDSLQMHGLRKCLRSPGPSLL